MSADLRLVPEADEVDRESARFSIRVVLANSHEAVRRSLRLLLAGEEAIAVVAEATDLPETVAAVGDHQPDVLVVDLRMRDGGSLGLLRYLLEQAPELAIIVLTTDDTAVVARQALAAGALGFVSKQFAVSELPDAVRAVARGETYVSPALRPHSQGSGAGAARTQFAP